MSLAPITSPHSFHGPCDDSTHEWEMRCAVNSISSELGEEAAIELLQTFLTDTAVRLKELRELAGGSDQATLRRAAHSLKGSSALFGAGNLEEAAMRLEEFACQQNRTSQADQAESIRSIFLHEVVPVLERLLRELQSTTARTPHH